MSAVFARFGIDARRFWLLMDLFDSISERGEMLDQLGRDGVALKYVSWVYFGMSGLLSLVMMLQQPPAIAYFFSFLTLSTFFLLTVLIPETSNSLVNPVEGFALAHQPINGATYTAAKLSHLLRVILYLMRSLLRRD
jgi:hypothetical protein